MNLTFQPLVSVLTPVYNCEKYLPECIESILAQTYSNWEYIIVNNCSTDHTLEIAQRYAEKDKRIRIHNNEQFLKVIQNHNHAFRQISPDSKYCKVVQADDWLFPECIERMVGVAESNPSVGIVGSYRLEEIKVSCDGLPYPSTVVSGKEICRSRLLGGPYLFGSPTTLLFRADLIRVREPFYNEKNFHGDQEVCFDILRDSNFGYVHQVLSFTRRHNETESTFARRLNTYILGGLIILEKYGPVYLNESEYKDALRKKIRGYYKFLGESIFQRKGKEFWDFHTKGLKELGFSMSYGKVILASVAVLYNRFLEMIKI